MNSNDALPVANPATVAALVGQYGADIERGLGVGKKLSDGFVTPSPCGDETKSRQIKVTGTPNPHLDSWYVDHSPYSEGIIAYITLSSRDQIEPAVTRLRDVLAKAGWQIREFNPWTADKPPTLAAEAPQAGYGTRVQGIVTDPNHPKIGVNISSPCVRHPDEVK